MKLYFTRAFVQDYRRLPAKIQKQIDKQLAILIENPQHPSLNIKKLNDPRDIWEGRVSAGYRFSFHLKGDTCILRKVGSHDILQKP